MQYVVAFTKQAQRDVARLPRHVANKLRIWVTSVRELGLPEVRMIPGFHDEPLKGRRSGQRSIRLNRSWRAIYVESEAGEVRLVEVQEVTHHGY